MPKKILLADDSITIQKVIELTFSDEDFEVVTVGNGRLAIEKLEEVRPDIVLCDIMMPEKDGYEVCQHIKSSQAFSHVPVLLLTGAFEPFDQEKAAKVGSDGFLAKPFEPETLIAKVKDLMGRAGAGRVDAAPPSTAADPGATEVPPPPAAAEQAVPPASLGDDPARMTTAPQPAVSPSSPAVPGLIPEEPFGALEEPLADAPSGAAEEALAPVSAEESASLAGEPPAAAPADADAASTVMFSAGDLPWTGQSPPPAPAAPPAAPQGAQPAPEPPASATPDLAEQAGAAFEEVLEEDLEFGGSGPSGPAPETTPAQQEANMFTPGEPLIEAAADLEPPPTFEVATPAAQEPPPEAPAAPEAPSASLETVPPLELEPPAPPPVAEPELIPTLEPETPPAASPPSTETSPPVFDPETRSPRQDTLPPVAPGPSRPEPPPSEAVPAALVESNLGPLAGPDTPSAPEPAAPASAPEPAPSDAGSFADIAPVDATEAPASEAASVRVPVDEVEKIAQRVAAQVSEKVVREIAWDVIPDLAEALIKQEIERLKAELQKL